MIIGSFLHEMFDFPKDLAKLVSGCCYCTFFLPFLITFMVYSFANPDNRDKDVFCYVLPDDNVCLIEEIEPSAINVTTKCLNIIRFGFFIQFVNAAVTV